MNGKLVFLVITSHFVYISSAVNILILEEVASPSHTVWLRSVAKALASKGYNVTVASPEKDESSTNIHYIFMDKVYETLYHSGADHDELKFIEMGDQNVFSQIFDYAQFSIVICDGHLKSDGWKQLENYPNDFKFDVIIHDFIMGGCLVAFAHKFKNVPLIGMTAFNDNTRVTSYVQSSVTPSLSPYLFYNHNPKTLLDRTFNFFMHMADKISLHYYLFPKVTTMIKESSSFKDMPSILELTRKSVIYMTNYDPSIDGYQQIPPNVIPVGGLQIKAASPLPEDLQSLADGATNGLILMSLGTNVQSEMLGVERITMILEAFRKLPKYTFIWKIDMNQLQVSLPSNVVIRKWVPQNDILAHKNTKLFITHAGLLSTQESIYHQVPMLGIPVFSDQFINIRRSVEKGVADVLSVKDLSTENLYTKLTNLLTQPKYRDQLKLASAAFRDQKETPLERAMWWIDWVIRNPNLKHFENSNLNFLQLESVDVIVFSAVSVFLSIYLTVWFFKLILKCIFGDRKSVNVKNKKE